MPAWPGSTPLTCLTIHRRGMWASAGVETATASAPGALSAARSSTTAGAGMLAGGERLPSNPKRPEEIISRKDTGRGYAGVRMVQRAARPYNLSNDH